MRRSAPSKFIQISEMPWLQGPRADSSDPGLCLARIPMWHTGSLRLSSCLPPPLRQSSPLLLLLPLPPLLGFKKRYERRQTTEERGKWRACPALLTPVAYSPPRPADPESDLTQPAVVQVYTNWPQSSWWGKNPQPLNHRSARGLLVLIEEWTWGSKSRLQQAWQSEGISHKTFWDVFIPYRALFYFMWFHITVMDCNKEFWYLYSPNFYIFTKKKRTLKCL